MVKHLLKSVTRVALLAVLCLLAAPTIVHGQGESEVATDWLRQKLGVKVSTSRDNGDMIRLVRPLTEKVKKSVVQVLSGGRPVALGTVVGADGYILTKRSELSADPIRVRLSDSRVLPARLAVISRRNDLALLKVNIAEDMTPIQFADALPRVGSFVISPGRRGQPVGVGVIGVRPRRIEHNGKLGVLLDDATVDQALVRGVFPRSGAYSAGVKPGDKIIAINGTQKQSRASVMSELHKMFPGENVELTIVREGDTLNLDASIRELEVLQESENDTKVNGPRSARLSGFESVIQHDTVLAPAECGGPMLDSKGRAVGLNIARAGRVVSYALPGRLVINEMLELLQQARNDQ